MIEFRVPLPNLIHERFAVELVRVRLPGGLLESAPRGGRHFAIVLLGILHGLNDTRPGLDAFLHRVGHTTRPRANSRNALVYARR